MTRRREPGGRRRKPGRTGSFETINITPFTDVLLVLLIIFMIAGSAMAPTGLSLSGLAAAGEGAPTERRVLTVEIDEKGGCRLSFDGQDVTWGQAERLPGSTPVRLEVAPSTTAQQVIAQYDRLLELGLTEIEWAPPTPVEP